MPVAEQRHRSGCEQRFGFAVGQESFGAGHEFRLAVAVQTRAGGQVLDLAFVAGRERPAVLAEAAAQQFGTGQTAVAPAPKGPCRGF